MRKIPPQALYKILNVNYKNLDNKDYSIKELIYFKSNYVYFYL